MKREKNMDIVTELTGLLKKINEGESSQVLRSKANLLIGRISPYDITHAEKKLLDSGLSSQKVQQLSATFILMGILENQTEDLYKKIPYGHILRKIRAEHEILQCFVADLEEVTEHLLKLDTISDTSAEFMRLSHILEHLNAMDEHMDRENDVIFYKLKEMGWQSLVRSAESEHMYLRIAVDDMVKLSLHFRNMAPGVFKSRLSTLTGYLCPALKEHLFHEDHVLFPLALQMINDPKIWKKLKSICEEINYCGIHI